MAAAGATAVVSAPILGTLNIIQNVQQQVNMVAYTVVNQLFNAGRDILKETGAGARTGVLAAGFLGGRSLELLGKAWHTVERVGSISLKTFLRIVEKASSSPEAIITAVLMYRVVDWGIAITPQNVSEFFDNMKKSVEAFSFRIPSVSLPRADITKIKDEVNKFFDGLQAKLLDLKKTPYIPEPEAISFNCVAPEWWRFYDVLAMLQYAFCVVAEAIVNGFARLGYYIAKLLIPIWNFTLDVITALLEFVQFITVKLVELFTSIANISLGIMEFIINGFVSIVNSVVSVFMEFVVKRPLTALIDYVLKPIGVFIASGYQWIKQQMKAILCEYIKTSPFLIGFTFALKSTYDAKRINSISKSLFTGLSKGFLGLTFTAMLTSMLVPECTLVSGASEIVARPQPPSEYVKPVETAPAPMEYKSLATVKLNVEDLFMRHTILQYKSSINISISEADAVKTTSGMIYKTTCFVKTSASETIRFSATQIHGSTVVLRLNVLE